MAIKIRAGEDLLDKHFCRTNRLIQANGHWFFLTRESGQEGPFSSANEAHLSLHTFLALTDSSLLDSVNKARNNFQPNTYPHMEPFTLHTLSDEPPQEKRTRVVTPSRIKFTPVAKDVKEITSKNKQQSANDGFKICFFSQ